VKKPSVLALGIFVFIVSWGGPALVKAQEYNSANNWAGDEQMLSAALEIYAQAFEQKSGFRFDKSWPLKVDLEYLPDNGIAEYNPEHRWIVLGYQAMYHLNQAYKVKWNQLTEEQLKDCGYDRKPSCIYNKPLDPEVVAKDPEISRIFRHELGHLWSDQVSRRNNLGPSITDARYIKMTAGQKIGWKVVTEGVGEYFENANDSIPEEALTALSFPASFGEIQDEKQLTRVAFNGGLWLVHDILSTYGERGMVWMLKHPYAAREDFRQSAVEYHEQALKELAKK